LDNIKELNNSKKTKRIAKNTLMLYFRMLFIMLISLYTSRVILETIGITDYGFYNVVGGVVTTFSFLSGAMVTGTQRYLSFELGKNDFVQLRKTFTMSLNIHIGISIVVVVFAETIGLWFLNNYLNIPEDRIIASNWVYQYTIITFVFSIIKIPYSALIIAHEKMTVFAYFSIIEVIGKLLVVFVLVYVSFDKLEFYSFQLALVALVITALNIIYTRIKYVESKYIFTWEKKLFYEMISYNGWNLWGNIASVSYNQGISILLNIFFGPVVNAARGITFQVNGAVNGFVSNFQVALNPQIIKAYSSGNLEYMHQLIYKGAKYSFFLLLLLTMPIIIETEYVLKLWLNEVPNFTSIFVKLLLVISLINSISGTMGTAILAQGNIKRYHMIVGGIQLLILPISYMFLKKGYSPEITLYITMISALISFYFRIIIVSSLVEIKTYTYLINVIKPIVIVTFFSSIIPIYLHYSMDESFYKFIILCLIIIFSISISIYYLGIDNSERLFIQKYFNKILKNDR